MSRKGTTRRRCFKCGRTVKNYKCSAGHKNPRSGGWEYTIDIGPEGGPRDRRTKGGFDTEKEALAAMNEIRAAAAEGRLVEKSNVTTGEYLTEWAAGVDVRASTRTSYEGHVRNHLLPRIGSIPLQQLERGAIKRAYADMAESDSARGKRLSPATVHKVHTTLHRALEDAVEDRLIPRNPADGAHKAPKAADREEMKVWTDGQVRDFLAHSAEDRLYALWRQTMMTGARRGELIGLRWDDIDLGARTITFTRQRSRQGDAVTSGPTKTGRGRRTIDIDAETALVLERWSIDQLEERMAWGDAYSDSGLVFTREDGQPLDPDGTSSRWNRLVKASGLPRLRFHDARHTHATILLKASVPPHVVSQRLGHSTVGFTLQQYAHVLPGQQAEAAAALAALVDGDSASEVRPVVRLSSDG